MKILIRLYQEKKASPTCIFNLVIVSYSIIPQIRENKRIALFIEIKKEMRKQKKFTIHIHKERKRASERKRERDTYTERERENYYFNILNE